MTRTITRASLLDAAAQFCEAFAQKKPVDEILSHFSSEPGKVSICEHGHPILAPFLGREYTGLHDAEEYFTTIGSLLSYQDMSFDHYFADAEASKVSVRGQALFRWNSTGQAWNEVFTYVLEFDEQCKVQRYEIWADTGAAYLASKGEL